MKKFLKLIKEKFLVSFQFQEDEIIIRNLLDPKHHKSGRGFIERKYRDYFLQLGGGVSVNRYRYADENRAKKLAKKINGRQKYIGFAVFRKTTILESFKEYKASYPNTNLQLVSIKATPLNRKNKPLLRNIIFVFEPWNIAHADLLYFNQGILIEQENTSIRNFSRILAANCKKLKDDDLDSKKWAGESFSKDI